MGLQSQCRCLGDLGKGKQKSSTIISYSKINALSIAIDVTRAHKNGWLEEEHVNLKSVAITTSTINSNVLGILCRRYKALLLST